MTAPYLILDGIKKKENQAIVVKYEDIANSPETTIKRLCEQLNIRYEANMINYNFHFSSTNFGDPNNIYVHNKPVKKYLDSWLDKLDTSQKIYIAKSYLNELGRETVTQLGYCYDELLQQLDSKRKLTRISIFKIPWKLLKMPINKLNILDKLTIKLIRFIEYRGFIRAFNRALHYLFRLSL